MAENTISDGRLRIMRLHFQHACVNENMNAGASTLIEKAQQAADESKAGLNVSDAFVGCVKYLHDKAAETQTPLTSIELEAIRFATSCFPDVPQIS